MAYTTGAMSQRPAGATLLVFTLGAEGETTSGRLLPSSLRGAEIRLRRSCLEAALTAGRASGCRLAVSSPHPLDLPADVRGLRQRGGDFGSRLHHALGSAFEGGGAVVVVGTDVPGLTPGHVAEALARLRQDPEAVVLGPSPDGGFYLLAAARPLADLLPGVRWCSRRTLASLRRALAAVGRRVLLLEPLADLDRPADLERWLARGPWPASWLALGRLLRELLAAHRRPAVPRTLGAPLTAQIPILAGRSPPA